jgi:hypothetical protein
MENVLNLHFHPKQWSAYLSRATEILYGGAAGGGKSFFLRVVAVIYACAIPGLQVYLFRRVHEDLIKNHMEGPKGYRNMLAGFEASGLCRIVDDEIRFWNGSKIYLCHCQLEKHRFKYQGSEIHLLLIDELTHFTEVIYRFLRSRVRMVGIDVPEQYRDVFPRIICGSNPGNVGHGWVKQQFVDYGTELWQTPDDEGGKLRQYIPARLTDNPDLLKDDPTYIKTLRGLGNPELVKAMEDGDWDVIAGAFFSMWDQSRHVVKPFTPPMSWLRFTATDWGSAKPFSTGLYAVVQDDYKAQNIHGEEVILPKGCLYRYKEYYGIAPTQDGQGFQPNVGVKLPIGEWAKQVMRMIEKDGEFKYHVADPAMFSENGGPSLAEEAYTKAKLRLRQADNKRDAGWQQVTTRLTAADELGPMLVFASTCKHAIRTIPTMQHDEHRVEDLDSDMEDHPSDEVRYACMSRPRVIQTNKPKGGPKPWTYDWIVQQSNKNQQASR